jgi:hypothetical protein
MPKTMKIMTTTSQSMKITLMMKTMIMKTATTTMKTTTEVEEEDEAETEISRETAREDLLQEAEEEVRAADREDLQVQIPADQDQDRVQDPAEEEGRLPVTQTTIIMITDMIIREDREEAETAAEDPVRVPAQTPEDHRIPIQEAAEETLVQVQDQETAAVQVEAPVQDLVTVLQEEVSHQ